ncbi:hypothetical protein KSC_057850 [Ktedonobacter sp. SOSP1-52]|uniref:hypothetical protein n=1 Tax=Ktedonobacter sp. SOSP1-52 TaxID=2778366 RepID=UPI00191571B7|nr:hypothetical protein [Ktedonobacter sp. SOSP1-52]GHO66893.1 hypothetical protein KSC_057850 [Ktedonobacter sp. SOSP1-52]
MSSAGNLPDWSIFKEREALPLEYELLSPAAEVAALLRVHYASLTEGRRAEAEAFQTSFAALAEQAVLVAQLEMLLQRSSSSFSSSDQGSRLQGRQETLPRLYKSLCIIKDQMLEALTSAGIEIEFPLGKSYEEVADFVEIEHWRHQQHLTEEIVIDVYEPIIRMLQAHQGPVLVRAGRVVMGAPLESEPRDGNHHAVARSYEEHKENGQATNQ